MSLFSGKKEASSGNWPREDNVSRTAEVHTLLGQGSAFEGKLSFEGQVRIDGQFSGEIATQDMLIIGEGAQVKADIRAGTVVIYGQMEGSIVASTLIELQPPARVRGSLETPALTIAKGVIWEGTTKMERTAAPAKA